MLIREVSMNMDETSSSVWFFSLYIGGCQNTTQTFFSKIYLVFPPNSPPFISSRRMHKPQKIRHFTGRTPPSSGSRLSAFQSRQPTARGRMLPPRYVISRPVLIKCPSWTAAKVAAQQTTAALYVTSAKGSVSGSKNNSSPVILFAAVCSAGNLFR